MVAAVTGASGHLGANLVRALLEGGRPVRAVVHRDRRAIDGLPIEVAVADVLDPGSLRRAFDGATTVYHLAGRISLVGDRDGSVARTNVLGTRNVVDACLACGVGRLVHFGSIHALTDDGAGGAIDETAPLAEDRRLPAYDRSKAAGQREVLLGVERGLDAVIVQPSATIGPYDFKPSRLGRVLIDLARRRLPALVASGYHWSDARDVAGAAIAAEQRGRTGASYLVCGPWRSVIDIARLVEARTGSRPPRLVVPIALARSFAPFAEAWGRVTGREPLFSRESLDTLRRHQKVSTARVEAEFGFQPRPLETTIGDTVDWLRTHGTI